MSTWTRDDRFGTVWRLYGNRGPIAVIQCREGIWIGKARTEDGGEARGEFLTQLTAKAWCEANAVGVKV